MVSSGSKIHISKIHILILLACAVTWQLSGVVTDYLWQGQHEQQRKEEESQLLEDDDPPKNLNNSEPWKLSTSAEIGGSSTKNASELKSGDFDGLSGRKSAFWNESALGQLMPSNFTTMSSSSSPPTTMTMTRIRNECFASNSDQWIHGDIFSNNANGITPKLLDDLLEGPRSFRKLPWIFDQTICHRDSPLRDFSSRHKNSRILRDATGRNTNASGDHRRLEAASVEIWYHRFLYLAMHWRFHRPALAEHASRKRCPSGDLQSFLDFHSVQPMDFECVGEKFVVVPAANVGLGAFLNTRASLSILLALRTNRIPIFSSASIIPKNLTSSSSVSAGWLFAPAHCDRKDMQCYFLPLSPCTITHEEFANAPMYGSTKDERKFLSTNVRLPSHLEDEKVVVIQPNLIHKSKDEPDMRSIASLVIEELLIEWKDAHNKTSINNQGENIPSWSDQEWKNMELAHQWIIEKTIDDPIGLLRQVYIYMLRPNPHYRNSLEQQMKSLVPSPIIPSNTFGIAIRGSDKCARESMCHSLDRYMEFVYNVTYPTLTPQFNSGNSDSGNSSLFHPTNHIRPNLIMTTEDPQVFKESLAYQNNPSFPFELLLNQNDNLQGSGAPKKIKSEAEETIISSLVALKFHFHAGKVYLNCCSNFHKVLDHLLQAQCGASWHGHDFVSNDRTASNETIPATTPPVAYCMNDENTPPKYRICCEWTRNCGEVKREYRREKGLKKQIKPQMRRRRKKNMR